MGLEMPALDREVMECDEVVWVGWVEFGGGAVVVGGGVGVGGDGGVGIGGGGG